MTQTHGMELSDLAKAPRTMRHLGMPRPFAVPRSILWEPATGRVDLDTGYDRLAIIVAPIDAEWLLSADALGGLTVRVAPSPQPHLLTIFAAWEGQLHSFSAEVV